MGFIFLIIYTFASILVMKDFPHLFEAKNNVISKFHKLDTAVLHLNWSLNQWICFQSPFYIQFYFKSHKKSCGVFFCQIRFKIPTVSSTPSSRIFRSIYFSYSGQIEWCTRIPIKNVRNCRCYAHIKLEIHNSGHLLAVPAADIDLSLPRLIRIHSHCSD